MTQRQIKAVALGGGHGLHATLSALRHLTEDVTAIVTVADDGGSSGRIRRELGILPPGDLRMALVALANRREGDPDWTELLQHRLGGDGALAGHPVGNLILSGLFEKSGDSVVALAQVASMVSATGRVLPMSPVPLDLVAVVDRFDPSDPLRTRKIRGQSSIAATPGRVRSIQLLPPGAPACAPAVDAVRTADVVVLGPGSWFTSVIPHLLLRELGDALARTEAIVIVAVNLVPQAGETDGFSPEELLRTLYEHHDNLRIDAVVADRNSVLDPAALVAFSTRTGSDLVMSDIAANENGAEHDPKRLGEAYREAINAVTSRRESDDQ
ncbi:uncharacterized cofD-like protein [Jatrophihabitans sp. GAS493]|uniref:gluconeogenesis factor YvcK family protein n=1 Tax=Jatrophihabitans sp. GAS493 TaxID=1907575 RepID=UPI000BC0309C|nr:uridine diphosphate-N-acetylglucosamine-binding protein YvcK [Jatrophihabitans sp. GAS493]SOD74018.1 uncharacterized cofD-like protein [Jatrophihabitans sp. GAS493]